MRYQAVSALILSLAIGLAASAAADRTRSKMPTPANLSGIDTEPSGTTNPEAGVSACGGLWRYLGSLSDIGLTDADLRREVTYIVADFDSNGSVDFLIWGRHEPSERGLRGTRSFKVLLFDGKEIIRAETIRHENYDHAVIWPRGRGSDGACAVLPQALDGIMLPGEGGGSWYYAYESSSRKLRGRLACDE